MFSSITTTPNPSSQLCVRANPQRFVSPTSSAHEQAIFASVSLLQTHPVYSSSSILTHGPLTASTGGIPLRVYTIGPGTRLSQNTSSTDSNLPDFDGTTFFAHFGGDDLTAEQFEVLWYFEEYARNGQVPAMNEEAKEKVRSLGFRTSEYPSSIYDKGKHEHVYKGWNADHMKCFWIAYCEAKIATDQAIGISREQSVWFHVNLPRALTAVELRNLERLKIKKGADNEKNAKLAVTLEQRIALTKKGFGSEKVTSQGYGGKHGKVKANHKRNRTETSKVFIHFSAALIYFTDRVQSQSQAPSRPKTIYGRGTAAKPACRLSIRSSDMTAHNKNFRHRHRGGIVNGLADALKEDRTRLEARRRRFERLDGQKQEVNMPALRRQDALRAPEIGGGNVFDGIPSALLDWCVKGEGSEMADDEIDKDLGVMV
ncbi:hypothetical protein MMC16_007759 [Acarospora aff. strigata]|nr:hypothetical protein [Acarospora aff. strigata]